jgi:hypothetical protein
VKKTVFDRVILAREDGERFVYTPEEFMAMPLHERIRHILGREVEFYLGEEPIDRGIALRALRQWG